MLHSSSSNSAKCRENDETTQILPHHSQPFFGMVFFSSFLGRRRRSTRRPTKWRNPPGADSPGSWMATSTRSEPELAEPAGTGAQKFTTTENNRFPASNNKKIIHGLDRGLNFFGLHNKVVSLEKIGARRLDLWWVQDHRFFKGKRSGVRSLCAGC